jgi:hypothetical protein
MGDGFRGHVLLYMTDRNFDMIPDEITRRTVVSKDLRIFFCSSGEGICHDTYMFNHNIPTDQNEWNTWLVWLKDKFEIERMEDAVEDPDSIGDNRTGFPYSH